jgi:predicted ATPase
MISRIVCSNYRSLGEDVTVPLGRLTALVGPNGSGKSNVADVLRFVSECLRVGLEPAITRRRGIGAIRRFSSGHPFDIRIHIDIEGDLGRSGFYEFVLAGGAGVDDYQVKREVAEFGRALGSARFEIANGAWKDGPADLRPTVDRFGLALPLVAADERFAPLAAALRQVAVYSIFPDTLREPQRHDPTRPMSEHGGNWGSILKGLLKHPPARQLRAALGQLTGDIDDFKVVQVGGYLVTQFRHLVPRGEGEQPARTWFDAARESDGTLRAAGIVTALLQEPPLTLLGVEEPELTIHPGALPVVYDFIREASERSQVLITTHSPDLLAMLNPMDVRVVTREHGITRVTRMDPSQREAVQTRLLTLGDVLRMEGIRPDPGNGADDVAGAAET